MREAYTSANALPYKLASDADVIASAANGYIIPKHVQFIPTNRCNLHCSFCSCENRDRTLEMGMDEIRRMVSHLVMHGTHAVTITGGGEPLLHPDINEIIECFASHGIQVGLVTNGVLLDRCTALEHLTWCRISAADERDFGFYASTVRRAVERAPEVDWAFSYVLQADHNPENLAAHLTFAHAMGFTHVRIVADLMDPDSIDMDSAVTQSPLAIWQPRTSHTRGTDDCRISLLKPVIGPDGKVYPCCGVQYAREQMDLDLPDDFSMGSWQNIGHMQPFDGSVCERCYYDDYNSLLRVLECGIEHRNFL